MKNNLDHKAHKKCIQIAKKNNHKKFLNILKNSDPVNYFNKDNKLSLRLFIMKTIIGQQISVSAAKAIWHKAYPIVRKKNINVDAIKNIGLSKMKQEYILSINKYFLKKNISKSYLQNCDITKLENIFLPIKGVGPWTLNIIRIFYIKDSDVWLPEDLGIRKSFNRFFTDFDMIEVSNLYKPYRSYLCLYLWRALESKS